MAKKEKADIWMPIYIGDYLADTAMLSTEQHGAYLLMLMAYWKNGPLPDDDEILANITRLPVDRWMKTRGLLLGYFSVIDGFLINRRADEEKTKADAFLAKQRANGAKGGRPPKQKNPDETQDKPMGSFWVNPNHNPNVTPSPSPLPSLNISSNEDMSPAAAEDVTGDDQHDDDDPKIPACPVKKIVDAYHQLLPELARCVLITAQREKQIRARWRSDARFQSIDFWERYFRFVRKSSFLMGDNDRGWSADIDFLFTASKFVAVLEGRYHKAQEAA